MAFLNFAKKNWFLIGIILFIIAAKWKPNIGAKGGFLKPEVTVKYLAVSFIFLVSGLSIKTEDLKRALLQVKVHCFVQGFTFIIFPLLVHFVVALLHHTAFDSLLLEGLTILSCLPPPVSSAVILTKAIGGNEAAAIFNSAFGSFLGIFITPVLILTTVGSEAAVPAVEMVVQLTLTVTFPLILGQVIRSRYKAWLLHSQIPFTSIGSGVLLIIIYAAFCDTFSHQEVKIDGISLVLMIFTVILLQICLLLLVFYIATKPVFDYHPADVIALLFCCTHKSLTLGVPLIKIIFNQFDGVSIITIPLLIYHPTQILLGGMLVHFLQNWLTSTYRFRPYKPAFYSV